jgi:hypothetical protein
VLAACKESIELDSTNPDPHFSLTAWYQAGSPELAATEAENGYRLAGKAAIADRLHQLYRAKGYAFAAQAAHRASLLLDLAAA